jgi:hypothetical protein
VTTRVRIPLGGRVPGCPCYQGGLSDASLAADDDRTAALACLINQAGQNI